jgi:hypothetical protein
VWIEAQQREQERGRGAEACSIEKAGEVDTNGLLLLGSFFFLFAFPQCFLDDGRRTMFDIVIQFSIQIDSYGWHVSIYRDSFPI